MKEIKEVLLKTARTPGLCSGEEIQDSLAFLKDFQQRLEIYMSAHGEPSGMSVLSKIDILEWYVENSLAP